ncbi:unnamed protein product [Paramecium primaurelia]|uniref:Uncharacterized protein n=1 Tax=Paramecium primaurelia TaxID=5886 RepID=A0A8S1K407_PARPR|nr:unnamed protein product [Paramecium primaurelia]
MFRKIQITISLKINSNHFNILRNDIIQNLQKELNDEWKERQKIEEEATNLITEQELEIDKLEKQLKMLEEQHSQ